jgi:hypothetical protein
MTAVGVKRERAEIKRTLENKVGKAKTENDDRPALWNRAGPKQEREGAPGRGLNVIFAGPYTYFKTMTLPRNCGFCTD